MTNKTSPQYVSIEQPFGCEPPLVHCPICGNKICLENEVNPCSHLAFLYIGEIGEFIYQSDAFENKFEATLNSHEETEDEDDYVGLDNLCECLAEAGYGNKLLVLEITYGGMACGPVWFTDVYGFDYDTLTDNED